MNGLPVLIETVISLVVLYIIFSIINSVLIEAFARWVKTRAKFLKNSLVNLFGSEKGPENVLKAAMSFVPKLMTGPATQKDKSKGNRASTTFVEEIYAHPLLEKLNIFDRGKVSSIDKGLFSDIVISIITGDEDVKSKEALKKKIEDHALLPQEMKDILKQVVQHIDQAKGDIFKQFHEHVSNWYDFYMQKLSLSYKNHIRKFLFISGLILATVINLDTIFLAEWFYENPDARESYVRLGEQLTKDSIKIDTVKLTAFLIANKNKLDANALMSHVLKNANAKSDETIEYTEPSALPLGVGKICKRPADSSPGDGFVFFKILGILITALALSFGAPFWFDVLKKAINAKGQLSGKQT